MIANRLYLIGLFVTVLVIGVIIFPIPDGCDRAAENFTQLPEDGFSNGKPLGSWETILPEGDYYTVQASARGGHVFSDGEYRKHDVFPGGTTLQNKEAYLWEAGWQCHYKALASRRELRLNLGIDYAPNGLYNPDELSRLHDWFTYNK